MVSYKSLGLSNTREMFKKAMAGKYAIPAYNFNNMEQLQAIIQGCINSRSPVILQVSKGARKYANQILLQYMAQGAMEMIKASGVPVPVALHLDHGDSYELCVSCIESGFSSVMIDGSAHPYDKNVELTKKVVDYAHQLRRDAWKASSACSRASRTRCTPRRRTTRTPMTWRISSRRPASTAWPSPSARRTAPTSSRSSPDEPMPTLRFDILEEVERRIPGFPIVLHGASSVLKEYVDIINAYGGKMEGAVGIPEEQLRKAARSAVCKINIDSDGRLVMTAMIRKAFAEDPKGFDPRAYLGPARDELMKLIERKNKDVLGSAGQA